MKNRNQEVIAFLVPDTEKRDGLLLTAWQRIVGGFKSRPFPQAVWNESFRAEVRYTAFQNVVYPIRAAIVQAIRSGDKALIAKTVEGARAFCRELEADFPSLVPQEQEESIVAVALEETHVEGPANAIEAALIAKPTPETAASAVIPLQRQHDQLGLLIEICQRLARGHAPMVSVSQ